MSDKCALHGQTHCPLCTDAGPPISPEGKKFFEQFPVSPANMAIDGKGNVLPYTPEEVNTITNKAIDQGRIRAVVTELPSGDYAVNVFGPPSQKLVEVLETTLAAYKRALKGH